MAVLSVFQTLPMLIVEKVVEYVDRRNRNVFDSDIALDIDEYNNTKSSHQLLWVSERWRVAALSIICDNCEIDFEHSRKGYSVKYPALPLEFSARQYDMKKSVKRVVAFAPSWSDIGSGIFGIASFQSESELPVFPSASTLMVCLDEDDANPAKALYSTPPASNSVPMDRNQEMINFVSSIRRLTPAATGVVVFFRSPSSTVKKNRGQCNTLVLQLCRGNITRLHVESLTECSLSTLKLHSVSELTTITQGVGVACPPFAQLAYRNASTLKVLNLRNVDESDWRTAIYGDTKRPAVFSSLTKVFVTVVDAHFGRTWAAIEHAVSFPALIDLSLLGGYPFNDDLLFRGNGGTLRKLCVSIGVLARDIFDRFNVFNGSSARQMKSIDIEITDSEDIAFVAEQPRARIVQQIHRILEATTVLYAVGNTRRTYVLDAIKTAPVTSVLQGLELWDEPHDASSILSIITAIPSLVTLTCHVGGSGSIIELLSANEHPNSLLSTYRSLNTNFRRLYALEDDLNNWDHESDSEDDDDDCPCCGGRFHHESDDDDYSDIDDYSDFDDSYDEYEGNETRKYGNSKDVAVVAAQVAVLCPNFNCVDLPKGMRKVFSREIALAMANGPFSPYANSLGRLIYPE